jgi:hypothetical protein
MTLKEAVRRVLLQYNGVLTAEEICTQIQRQNLFRKRDGTFPDVSYLLLRIKHYLDEFEFIVRLRG